MRYDDTTDSIVLLEVILYEGSVVTFGCNEETYAIKSAEDFAKKKEELDFLTEDLLKELPRTKQYEFRQLISKHISLAKAQPAEPATEPPEDEPIEGVLSIGEYKINVNEF
jgi:hypothetical protein